MKQTQCGGCSKTLEYTTKKPRLCPSCKLGKKEPKKRGGRFPKNRGTSGELQMFSHINQVIMGLDFINHGYYSFLLSPKYQPMQLDRYYPDIKLAFEYDGKQHNEYIKYIHKSKSNFLYYQECDKLKTVACRDKGITLVRVSHKDKLSNDLIRSLIKQANPKLYDQLLKQGIMVEEHYE